MYCRYENRGRCELNKKECVPASKGCVIKTVPGVTLIDDTKKQPPKKEDNTLKDHFEEVNSLRIASQKAVSEEYKQIILPYV